MGRAKDEALTNQLIDYLMGEGDGMPQVLYFYHCYCVTFLCYKIFWAYFVLKFFVGTDCALAFIKEQDLYDRSMSHSPSNSRFRNIRKEAAILDIIIFSSIIFMKADSWTEEVQINAHNESKRQNLAVCCCQFAS